MDNHHSILLARADTPANSAGASTDAADPTPLPDIGRESILLVCPDTKHPVNPFSHCIRVAIVESGKVQPPSHEALQLGLTGVVVLIAAFIGTVLARRLR